MAYYYSLRGWLEVEPENFARVVEELTTLRHNHPGATKLGLYLQGWCWSQTPVNWTRYVFFGADVTHEGLEFFRAVLGDLTKLNLDLSGYFHAQGEDGAKNLLFRLTDDRLEWKDAGPKVEIT